MNSEVELNDALARLASARWWPEPEGRPHKAAFTIPVDEEHDADCILGRAIDELLALRVVLEAATKWRREAAGTFNQSKVTEAMFELFDALDAALNKQSITADAALKGKSAQ